MTRTQVSQQWRIIIQKENDFLAPEGQRKKGKITVIRRHFSFRASHSRIGNCFDTDLSVYGPLDRRTNTVHAAI